MMAGNSPAHVTSTTATSLGALTSTHTRPIDGSEARGLDICEMENFQFKLASPELYRSPSPDDPTTHVISRPEADIEDDAKEAPTGEETSVHCDWAANEKPAGIVR